MRAAQFLYPSTTPFDQRMLDVGNGHKVYVEQCGNPDGIPVVVLHGGPGGGTSPAMRRYFDPAVYRVVLFDQRGCGRSTPLASVENNTTWDLIRDAELIRKTLGIRRWVLFGGSWGATLALIYAETHPEVALHLVLRGVFLMTQSELDWFYGGGAGHFWPDVWKQFVDLVPVEERGDLISAYHKRLFGRDMSVQLTFARAWCAWENALAAINSNGASGFDVPADYARTFARLENHYFINHGFLEEDGQILRDIHRLKGINGTIVQGRYDMICPPVSAYNLAKAWPDKGCDLRMIPNSGHALSEPGITAELVRIMDNLHNTRLRQVFTH